MKSISLHELEECFDLILDDVANNRSTYLITTEKGNVVMMPYDEYDALKNIYGEWLNETGNLDY